MKHNTTTPVFIKNVPSVYDDIFTIVDNVFSSGVTSAAPDWKWDPHYGNEFELPVLFPETCTLDSFFNVYKGIKPKDIISTEGIDYAKEIFQTGLPSFPASDIYLDNDKGTLNFELALPGYSLDDLSIDFADDYMTIEVKKDNSIKKNKKEAEGRVYLKQGLKSSSIRFKVPVPVMRFNVTDAKAEYTNGMLQVVIPRAEAYKPHKLQIDIKSSDKK